MNTWFSVDLGDAVLAICACADIERAFQPLFAAAGRPADMAIFKRHDDDRSLHCAVTVFFSPAAAQVAVAFGATACPKPARPGLELIAGDSASWSALFAPTLSS